MNLHQNNKGVSEVVTTVLLVMVGVIAISVLAAFLIPFVRKNLEGSADCMEFDKGYITVGTSEYTCSDNSSSRVMIKRESNELSLNSIRVSITSGPESKSYTVKEETSNKITMLTGTGTTNLIVLPSPGGARTYVFNESPNGNKVEVSAETSSGRVCKSSSYSLPAC